MVPLLDAESSVKRKAYRAGMKVKRRRSNVVDHETKTVWVASENENKHITGKGGKICKYRCSIIRKPTPKATKMKA